MANAMALINEGLWRKDKDFQQLPRSAQCTYCQILSQKDLDTVGGLTLHLELMAKACDELTVEQLKTDLGILEDRRFVFVDYDTDELLVRSYVRLVSAVGERNKAWLSVPKNARLIGSEKLRRELAVELRRLRRKEANELADEIDPTPTQPPSNPLGTPSKTEGGSNPHSQVPVLDLVSPSLVSSVGVRARPTCPKHETDSDTNCRACMRRRLWDEENAAQIAADELRAKREERELAATCPDCHGTNLVEVDDNAVRKCLHPKLHQPEASNA